MTNCKALTRTVAKWLRRISIALDHSHLVVIEKNKNGATMAAYLAALARKKDFIVFTDEYFKQVKTKESGRYVKAL